MNVKKVKLWIANKLASHDFQKAYKEELSQGGHIPKQVAGHYLKTRIDYWYEKLSWISNG